MSVDAQLAAAFAALQGSINQTFQTLSGNAIVVSGGGGGGTASAAVPTDNFMVAGGIGTNVIAYSYDGITWIPSTSAIDIFTVDGVCLSVAWNGVIWVAVGINSLLMGSPIIAHSSDGINWTESNDSSIFSECITVAWNGSIWLAGGGPGMGGSPLASSPDGINWTAISNQIFVVYLSLAWNGIMWVAVSSRVAGSPYPAGVGAAYSYDGINWTAASGVIATGVGQVLNITWNGSRWFASCIISSQTIGSYYQTMITSVDGINWTLDSSASSLVSNVIYDVSSRRFITYDPPSRRQLGGTGTTSAGGTGAVNFGSTLFSTTPIITATVTGVNPAAVLLSSMGPTGFTATTYNPSFSITGPVPFNWNAIQL
jgi:hypothetical protein